MSTACPSILSMHLRDFIECPGMYAFDDNSWDSTEDVFITLGIQHNCIEEFKYLLRRLLYETNVISGRKWVVYS